MKPTLTDLKIIARQAGVILQSGYGQKHQILHKGIVDIVTEVDKRSEEFIIGQISGSFPDHTIITEESGRLEGMSGHCWYIDPLDGTTNYAHGLTIYCVSLAYAENNQVQLGVVYNPVTGECFSAERGKGAWLNGSMIHVSAVSELIDSLLAAGFPYDMEFEDYASLRYFEQFCQHAQAVRRMGSAALGLCEVASGRLDGYWQTLLYSWDIAAGSLIVEEAGGIVSDMDGSQDYLSHPCSVVAGCPAIHGVMLVEMQETEGEQL